MMPFEAWISADDRQNGGNVLLGHSPSGAIGAAWIDYAFALDHVWKGNNVSGCNVPPMYPTLGAPSVDIMKAVAQSIAELERAAIEGILNRIPPSFLPRNVADSIGRNLLSRRAGVRALWP
jgi:hypothetical protein